MVRAVDMGVWARLLDNMVWLAAVTNVCLFGFTTDQMAQVRPLEREEALSLWPLFQVQTTRHGSVPIQGRQGRQTLKTPTPQGVEQYRRYTLKALNPPGRCYSRSRPVHACARTRMHAHAHARKHASKHAQHARHAARCLLLAGPRATHAARTHARTSLGRLHLSTNQQHRPQ